MRSISALLAIVLVLLPASASAHWICLYGSYYKERSTRVISPMIEAKADLPYESELQVGYLIDQITSASAAVTPGADTVFKEYRHEVDIAAAKRFFGFIKPIVKFRYSDEPDYKSVGFGADLEVELFDRNTTLHAGFGYLNDTIGMRPPPNQATDPNATRFREHLNTPLFSLGVTQVLAPSLIGAIDLEAQIPRGFQENQYRVEQHPEARNRYAVATWLAYRIEATRTTIRADYRFYADTWRLRAHSAEVRITQRILPSLEIEPRFHVHFQNGVYFVDAVTIDDQTFRTEDPKLKAFNAQTFGLQISWQLSFLQGTALDVFSEAMIQPYYAFLRQTNAYGNAHIAQLGVFWPF